VLAQARGGLTTQGVMGSHGLPPCRRVARGSFRLLLIAAAWLAARPLAARRLPGVVFVAPEHGHTLKKVAVRSVPAHALELSAAHRAALWLPPVQPLDHGARKQDGFQAMLPFYSGVFIFQIIVFLSLVDWAA